MIYKKFILLSGVIILLFLISGCDYLELSTTEEITMGEQVAMEVESYYDLYRDREAVERVRRIGKEMARFTSRPFLYNFRVLDSDEINAFALPGGYIYIYRGLLDMGLNDDQLAAIISHEITHIEADHFATVYERMKKKELFYNIVVLATGGVAYDPLRILAYLDAYIFEPKYSRENETECDISSVQMLIQAGRNPYEFAELFKMWEQESLDKTWIPSWMKSHPDFITRIQNIEEEISLQKLLMNKGITCKPFSKISNNEFKENFDYNNEIEDYLSIKNEKNTLNISWTGNMENVKKLEVYGLNEKQKVLTGGRTVDSPFSITLDKGDSVKYLIASVKYKNGEFLWGIIRV